MMMTMGFRFKAGDNVDEHMVNVAKRRADFLKKQTEEEWKEYLWKEYLHDRGWNSEEVEKMLKIAQNYNSLHLFD